METSYAPWRSGYFLDKEKDKCEFCHISAHANEDEKAHVIYRDKICFIVMNLYPYTPGHFLIIPHEHIDSPDMLEESTWLHLNKIARQSTKILYDYGAKAINMGINIKYDAGAGIPEHIHIHMIPRWARDTNFYTTIANSRAYGVDFEAIYKKMKALAIKHIGDIDGKR